MKNKTLKEIIGLANELNPNAYSDNIKAQWVNEVEAYIQTEIYNVAPLDVVSYTDYEESKDKELSLDAVNDKIYLTYLQAMIDFSNKEYQAFNNDIALYNTYIDTYAKWYVRTHGEGVTLISGMYLSAYGIAVKHGFNGSEEEWIASLKGEKGDTGDIGNGLEIKGTVTDIEDLPTDANYGDVWAYLFEVESNPNDFGISELERTGELYFWNGSKWENLGSYRGAKGDKGDRGYKGDEGVGIERITTAPSGDGAYTIIFIHTSDGNTYEAYIPKGKDGADGTDGVGIESVESIPFGDEYSNLRIRLTDGRETEFSVYNGKKGEDGYTPIRGTDYWTEADKAEIKSYVDEAILGGSW